MDAHNSQGKSDVDVLDSNDNSQGFRVPENTRYMVPLGLDEPNRLDYQHYVIRHFIKGNFFAPITAELEKGIRVLDVGCGSGSWTLDMANDYPNSTFIATDCIDSFNRKNIPPNCTFVKANTLEGLPFPDESFDYVFQRLMMGAFSPKDWGTATREFARILKPGGVVELMESDPMYKNAPLAYLKLHNAFISVSTARGIDLSIVHRLAELLTDAGFENAQSGEVSFPLGWNGYEGEIALKSTGMLHRAMRPVFGPILGMSDDEYEEYLVELHRDCTESKAWFDSPYSFATKPKKA